MTDAVLSSVGLSDAVANCRHYLALHPIEDPHLAILIGALLSALQTYALRETEEITGGDEDWPGAQPLPPARLNS